jgi:hypothetical protein
MRVEITLDELNLKLRDRFFDSMAREAIEKEFRKVTDKHKEAMMKEMDELIASITVNLHENHQEMIRSIVISTPE